MLSRRKSQVKRKQAMSTFERQVKQFSWRPSYIRRERVMELACLCSTYHAQLFLILWHLLQHLREIFDVGLQNRRISNESSTA